MDVTSIFFEYFGCGCECGFEYYGCFGCGCGCGCGWLHPHPHPKLSNFWFRATVVNNRMIKLSKPPHKYQNRLEKHTFISNYYFSLFSHLQSIPIN